MEELNLSTTTWIDFENDLFDAACLAIKDFQRIVDAEGRKIYQISIWTHLGMLSVLAIETLQHAKSSIEKGAKFWFDRHDLETARRVQAMESNGNPADFEFPRVLELQHSESLSDLQPPEELEDAITLHQENVLRRILESGVLTTSNCEDYIWVGVSSKDDWYDHERKVAIKDRNP